FHADVSSAGLADDAFAGASVRDGLGDGRADGVSECDVSDEAFAEKRGDAAGGSIDKLVGDDEVRGLVLFLERADGGNREDALDAELLHGVDVGAEVQLRGEDAVAARVTSEEGDLAAFEFAENEGVAGFAEGGFDPLLVDGGKSGHGVEAAASDDSYFCLLQIVLRWAEVWESSV